jgi:hypothetical protein
MPDWNKLIGLNGQASIFQGSATGSTKHSGSSKDFYCTMNSSALAGRPLTSIVPDREPLNSHRFSDE